MISLHQEIEAKLSAENVSVEGFIQWILSKSGVIEYKRVSGPDHYFENGDAVVRHRDAPAEGLSELTVKLRKSATSTRDRLEVDLHFLESTKAEDIHTFLRAIGFKEVFTLVKEAHIFYIRLTSNLTASFVLYEVWRDDVPTVKQKFIEIEACKGSQVLPETAKRHISTQVKELREKFGLGEPLNNSLWEIYSGRKYQQV